MEAVRVTFENMPSNVVGLTKGVPLPDIPGHVVRIHKVHYAMQTQQILAVIGATMWSAMLTHNLGSGTTHDDENLGYAHASWHLVEQGGLGVGSFPGYAVVDLSPGFDVGGRQVVRFVQTMGVVITRVVTMVYFELVNVGILAARTVKSRTMKGLETSAL